MDHFALLVLRPAGLTLPRVNQNLGGKPGIFRRRLDIRLPKIPDSDSELNLGAQLLEVLFVREADLQNCTAVAIAPPQKNESKPGERG